MNTRNATARRKTGQVGRSFEAVGRRVLRSALAESLLWVRMLPIILG
jgi:hypothetical protein